MEEFKNLEHKGTKSYNANAEEEFKDDESDESEQIVAPIVKDVSMLSIIRDRRFAGNTLILCLVWSSSAYSYYFTEFYMKYVPVSNVYYLAILMGCSDCLTCTVFN